MFRSLSYFSIEPHNFSHNLCKISGQTNVLFRRYGWKCGELFTALRILYLGHLSYFVIRLALRLKIRLIVLFSFCSIVPEPISKCSEPLPRHRALEIYSLISWYFIENNKDLVPEGIHYNRSKWKQLKQNPRTVFKN